MEALESPASTPALEEETVTRWREVAQAELTRQPRARSWKRAAAILGGANALLAVVAILALSGRGLVLSPLPAFVVWSLAPLFFALMAVGSWMALSPSMRGARAWRHTAGLLVTGLAVALAGSALTPLRPFALAPGCIAVETLVTAPLALLALLELRRFAATPAHGLMAALAAGLAGLVALHLHCVDPSLLHVLHAHLLPWLALAGIAALLVRRMRPRSFAP